MNERTVSVEYRDERAAEAAGALGIVREQLESVTLAVGVRAAKGYVFYFGLVDRS